MLDTRHKLSDSASLSKKEIKEWIIQGPNLNTVQSANQFGDYIGRRLKKVKIGKTKSGKDKFVDESVSTSQIRQVFSKMKMIEAKGGISDPQNRIDFLMIKPLLAYAVGRHKKTGLDRLKDRLGWAIETVLESERIPEQEKRFGNFCKLFEAILAYHRASGGK